MAAPAVAPPRIGWARPLRRVMRSGLVMAGAVSALAVLLAALFAVTADYDGQARWQDVAPGLRQEFARAGRNTKVGTDATYNEATARKRDLDELIRGSRPEVPAAEKTAKWGEVADRPPLRIFEMELKRIGDSSWPAGDAVPMR